MFSNIPNFYVFLWDFLWPKLSIQELKVRILFCPNSKLVTAGHLSKGLFKGPKLSWKRDHDEEAQIANILQTLTAPGPLVTILATLSGYNPGYLPWLPFPPLRDGPECKQHWKLHCKLKMLFSVGEGEVSAVFHFVLCFIADLSVFLLVCKMSRLQMLWKLHELRSLCISANVPKNPYPAGHKSCKLFTRNMKLYFHLGLIWVIFDSL